MMDKLNIMEKDPGYDKARREQGPLPVMAENIPVQLTALDQWVCWRYEEVEGRSKPAKAPYDPLTGVRVDVTQREALRPFEVVLNEYTHSWGYDGIGFSLMADDGIVGVDIDECIDKTGEFAPLASDVIELLNSYSEISPSGRGIRIFTTADLGEFTGRRKGSVELYNYNRYLTVAGRRLSGAPAYVAPRLAELRELYRRYLMPEQRETPARERFLPPTAADDEVLERMFRGRFGDVYEQIYHGDLSNVQKKANGDPDGSHADILLCNGLAFYTGGDPVQMRRILLSSPRALQRLAKWEKRMRGAKTYMAHYTEDAIQYTKKA